MRGFEVESFILGSAPKAPGLQHLFSCCLVAVVVWQSGLLRILLLPVLCL